MNQVPGPDDFVHRHRETIRWGDMDAFGHVNNVEFFRYLESARVEYAMTVLAGEVRAEGENIILADLHCAFRRQLRWPGQVDVYTRTKRVGGSSIGLQQIMCLADTDTVAASADTVLVWFDFKRQKPTEVPAGIRAGIARYEKLQPEGV
jgi:acyl-CoA thioester hydrolase